MIGEYITLSISSVKLTTSPHIIANWVSLIGGENRLCVCVLGRERESDEEGGGRECVCEDLMVKKVANVVILNS